MLSPFVAPDENGGAISSDRTSRRGCTDRTVVVVMTNLAPPADVSPPSAGLPVVELVDRESAARAACRVLAAVWAPAEPMPAELVWALAHTGNYVATARIDGEVVGAAVAFRAVDGHGEYLHSHITGVLPGCQGREVGFRLKQHQRGWALQCGLERVTWTFDPLVARNAYFNVMKLGAQVTGYHPNFYGRMSDGVNDGDESDRAVATWWLRHPRVLAAAQRDVPGVDVPDLQSAGAAWVLEADSAGWPVTARSDAPLRLVHVPTDIVTLRRHQPSQALAWRAALRDVLADAFADQLSVVAVSRDARYVLGPGEPATSLASGVA